jgi:ERCC4-related helicase
MKYRGKDIEVIGEKTVFGQHVAWIHVLEDNSFLQVLWDDLTMDAPHQDSMAQVRYAALAARIREEIGQKHVLAPYESSLLPLPHQLLILEKVMKAPQTRFLLADEVGMGKTIEAGLILKELKLRGDIKRTLLIVPKSAMPQWQSEMKEHFKENFQIYDSQLISSLAKMFSQLDADEELNFWRQHNQIIVSTDALKPLEHRQGWSREKIDQYNKYRIEAVVNADFDLVIIDEAHKMGGSSSYVSRYQLASTLSNAVPRLLLLSATPHRGKSDHFRRVMQLIDEDAFSGEDMPSVSEIAPYVLRTEKRNAVDYNGKHLFNKRQTIKLLVPIDDNRYRLQRKLYGDLTEYVRSSFNKAKENRDTALALVMTMFQKIAGSSTAAIRSALGTRLENIKNNVADEAENYEPELDMDEVAEIVPMDYCVQKNADNRTEEECLEDLIQEADKCLSMETDAKADQLCKTIGQLCMEEGDAHLKVIVFTEFRATQDYLIKVLTAKGYSCQGINGSMTLEQRQQALRHFKEDSNVMVTTDAAGESLNMQFCHIVFNYDLPWNPMTIEQRIGRVDRIGQKHPVKAFNMLTSNSIDARVYSIIVEKLDIILEQLGIDKTSDVLDSTIEMNRVNHIYLQSLLDPGKMEQTGDNWLSDIKKKLRNYKSTEGLLPSIPKEEIDSKSAAAVKYSPLPVWLEQLTDLYVRSKGGQIQKTLYGVTHYQVEGRKLDAVFDAEHALDNPQAEQITLQHDWTKRILGSIDANSQQSMPVIQSRKGTETKGIFSLWKVSASNDIESKYSYVAEFVADNGKIYPAYANQIWNKLVENQDMFECFTSTPFIDVSNELMDKLLDVFHRMENEIIQHVQLKSASRLKALEFQKKRAGHIGIENIRNARIKHIENEEAQWLDGVRKNKHIVPDLKNIINVRING